MVFDNEGRRGPATYMILVAADAGRFYGHVWPEVTPMLQSKQRARAYEFPIIERCLPIFHRLSLRTVVLLLLEFHIARLEV